MMDLIPTSLSQWEPYALSIILMGFFVCIAPALPQEKTWARVLIVAIGIAVAFRYLAWRLLETLVPEVSMSIEGAWFLGIYLTEVLTFINYSTLFLVLSRRVDRSAEADRHEAELRRRPAELLPSVDVFIPTYNEGPEVVERSILAALQIDYPKFQVWVLDDGGREWLAEFCAENGAHYVHRRERSHAKAGNLNHGLSVSQGELFAIFDADFAPRRDFLYRTVGFFSDPRIGIVQTPQHFFNRDPIQHNLRLSEILPDEQRLFFDVIAPCRDAWDSAFCCGSCSLQRRSAIAGVGGVPTDSITEDILSTLVLLRRGFVTRYLNEQLSMGLAAESLKGYFTQRQRWCRGAIQTLFLKFGPLGPGLTPLQRLLFLPLDWVIQYAARLVAVAVPILFLWTGLRPFRITSIEDLVSYQLPAIIALASIFRLLASSCYVPVFSSAVALFTAVRITPTVLASLIKPFGVPFRVTPKGSNNDASGVDRPLLVTVTILAALTLGGLLFNRISPNAAGPAHASLIVAEVYALFNLVLLAIAAVLAIEIPSLRRGERFRIKEPGSCRKGSRDLACWIRNISESGALLEGPADLEPGDWIELKIGRIGALPARVVRRSGAGTAVEFGVFSKPLRQRLIDFIYSAGLCNRVAQPSFGSDLSGFFSHLFNQYPGPDPTSWCPT
ncbi:MAG: glycosyltransferase [Planctomycetaceae bacterium]